MEKTAVGIVIQARSTSKRFPGKVFAKIGSKELLQHVSDACTNASNYINKMSYEHGITSQVCIAVPYKDEILKRYTTYRLIEGPEDDVLSRYVIATEMLDADYIVRVTSDCPFVPPFVISKCIRLAVTNRLDYITNAHPSLRTSPDGHDVQIVSKRLLYWLNENVKDAFHREHVLSYLDEKFPEWASKAFIIGHADFSSIKLSVDTEEDLNRMKQMHEKIYSLVNKAGKSFRL